jgi:oligopeptide transport system ATP-binding protein
MTEALLEMRGISKSFTGRSWIRRGQTGTLAVDDVSLMILPGQTMAVVGESGSGKTTLARCAAGATTPDSGVVLFGGAAVQMWRSRTPLEQRRRIQMIFQDPSASLDPRMRAGDAIAEGIRLHRLRSDSRAVAGRVREIFDLVGLPGSTADRLPHELSGGQRQRVAIARAVAVEPSLLICDEAVSALDVSVQAQVLNLFLDLQRELQLTYLFVTHDLGVVRQVADQIAVMYRGRIVEQGPAKAVLDAPAHPYTELLLASVPVPDPKARRPWESAPASVRLARPPAGGCAFLPRCPIAQPACAESAPALFGGTGPSAHSVACFERRPEGS